MGEKAEGALFIEALELEKKAKKRLIVNHLA
jgi:hypothetical protein